jgi:peptidoglycan/LPS O-acetylase OafA/YrhL
LHAYFLRRLTRLEPPYIASLLILTAAGAVLGKWTFEAALPHLLVGSAYLHGLVFREMNPISDVAWSLEIEVQFYVLVPLLASVFLVRRRWARRSAILAGAVVALVVSATLRNRWPWLAFTIVAYLQYFAVGFLLADVYVLEWERTPTRSGRWDAAWILAWAGVLACIIPRPGLPILRTAVLPLLLGVVAAAGFKGTSTSRILSVPWLFTTGGMCYSIYLIHHSFLSITGRALIRVFGRAAYLVEVVAYGVVAVGLVVACSIVFFVLIERPCMDKDWPTRLRARFRRF